jgi:RNA-directed DNA polymerase
VTNTSKEMTPSTVPNEAKQDGQTLARWTWVEPSVWTERMLQALVNGVKGGKWFSLMDKVYSPTNLEAAWKRVERKKGAAGVDGQSVEQFAAQAESSLKWLHDELREGRYKPLSVRRHWIPKPGTNQQRPLGIPAVRDRIVQGALRHALEPIFEKKFVEHSYGFRPKRSCKDALRRVEELLRRGFTHVVDADITSYFDMIVRTILMDEIKKEVADGRVLGLIEMFLEQSVMDGMKEWEPETGTPQGAVISPLLANIYLHPVDEAMARAGFEMVRYADDLVILCKSEEDARKALKLLTEEMTKLKQTLHPEKTRIVDLMNSWGFEFLGYHFNKHGKKPRKKSLTKFKENVRELTPRNHGNSLEKIISRLNQTLRGWFSYFKHSNKTTFRDLDSWIRRRLRAILLRRQHRRGKGHDRNTNYRWPNAYFAKFRLFTMTTARMQAVQSR